MRARILLALTLVTLVPGIAGALTDGPRYGGRELDCTNNVCSYATGTEDGLCDITTSGNSYLRLDLFGLTIPAEALSIDGVTVEVKTAHSGCTGTAQLAILNPAGDVKTLPGPTTGDCSGSTYQTLGGPSDTWGLALTRDDVQAPLFGVVFRSDCAGVLVDAARITVHYTTTAGNCGNSSVESPEECDDGNTVRGDGCSAVCDLEAVPSKTEQKCVNAMNKAGAALSQSVGAAFAKCAQGFVKNGESFADCNNAYRGGPLVAATGKIAASAEKLCDPAPPFAFVDASTTSDNAVAAMDALTQLVLGSGPALANTEPEAACQAAVLGATRKLLATRATLFNKCKSTGLAGKNTTQILSDGDLLACLTALPDAAGKVAKAEAKMVKAFQAKCGAVNLATTFPAPCGGPYSLQDVAACLSAHVAGIWCQYTAAGDGLSDYVTCP